MKRTGDGSRTERVSQEAVEAAAMTQERLPFDHPTVRAEMERILQAALPAIEAGLRERLLGVEVTEALARHLYGRWHKHGGKSVAEVDALWAAEPENIKHRLRMDARLALRAALDTAFPTEQEEER